SLTYGTAPNTPWWIRNSAAYSALPANAFTFEGIICASATSKGSVSLFNNSTAQQVTSSEFTQALPSPILTQVPFSVQISDSDPNFTDLSRYEVQLKNDQASGGCGGNNCYTFIARAGIWIRLQNLTRGEVYYRLSR